MDPAKRGGQLLRTDRSPRPLTAVCSALLAILATSAAGLAGAQSSASVPVSSDNATLEVPAWLFPINTPTPAPAAAPTSPAAEKVLLTVPNSRARFTRAQLGDLFSTPDWQPESHPPMPAVVAHGRRTGVYACGYCHLPDGRGRPENATLAGLPAGYIVQQVKDMAHHVRRSASAYLPSQLMFQVAEQAFDVDLAEAAAYFSARPLRRARSTVIESAEVPKTHMEAWLYAATPGGGTEALGHRIIEMPRDLQRHERRDPTVEYVAYVPPGSLARGRELATSGGVGRTLPCASCHGIGLRGVGVAPPIAGRSPTYLLRQLLAFRTGARDTEIGRPMQIVAAQLDLDDMIAVAAFAGSRVP